MARHILAVTGASAIAFLMLQGFTQTSPAVRTEEAPRQILRPRWVKQPTAAEIQGTSLRRSPRVGGQATLNCRVNESGRLRDCAVVSEGPPSLHFGDRALTLAPYYQMQPTLAGGSTTEGARVEVTIAFPAPQAPRIAQNGIYAVATQYEPSYAVAGSFGGILGPYGNVPIAVPPHLWSFGYLPWISP